MTGELDALFKQFLDMGIPAYDCLIYHKGHEVYRQMAGFSDREKKTPLSGQEWYNVYSASKLITATVVLQLVQEGRIALRDKLSDYMPEFAHMQVKTSAGVREAHNAITISQLMTMTAGLNYDRSPKRSAWCKAREASQGLFPTVQTLRFLAQEPLEFEPGTDWQYSLGLDILAAVVEIVSGERFGEYVKKRLFMPLGMNQSTFASAEIPVEKICAQYRYEESTHAFIECDKGIQNGYQLGKAYESGGAGCVSTVMDFMLLLEAIRKGEVLRPEMVALMTTNQLAGQAEKSFWRDQADQRYGYGLGVGCPNGNPEWDCFGWGGAAGAFCAVDQRRELSIFYVQHVLNRPNKLLRREIYHAAIMDMGIDV